MRFEDIFPANINLTEKQKNELASAAVFRTVKKGDVIHGGGNECTGLLLLKQGQLRAYILSSEGREITIYRLFDMDMCLFSASCIMNSINFDITVEAEKDTELWIIKPETYKKIMEQSCELANYTNEVMAARFSEVMWLIEQIMWKSLDKRIAGFLTEESVIEQTVKLDITHETIANHIGTHREVVTRMLKYFQSEGMVKLSRGSIEITDEKRLFALSEE